MVTREEVRLRELFRRVLLVSIASSTGAGAMIACSDSASSASGDAGGAGSDASVGGHDATTSTSDAGADGSAATDAGGLDAAKDTAPASCAPGPLLDFDAGEAGPGCAYAAAYPCGLPSFVTTLYPPACYLALRDCAQICTGVALNAKDCRVAEGYGCDSNGAFVAPDGGPIKIECAMCAGVGRRPSGLARATFGNATTALGDFFARVAHLEAASVDAFVALGDELAARGAPRALVKMAARCARDERRHARITSRLARRFGGDAPAPRVAPARRRSVTTMAIENAVEGCVRETFGAMVATWQAAHAGDGEIAAAMERIAIDETRHAAMAWAVAQWLEIQLDARGRARVATAKRAAIADLRREMANASDDLLVQVAGLPSEAQARRLVDAIDAELWAPHRASTVTS